MVQSHIKSLLYTYDCVIIPDFGGLITHYAPAKIHPVKHTFTPPSKRVAFNEQLKVNDGLLISTLAQKQKWPMPQAQKAVAEFVQELKEQLLTQHRFELKDVGVFRYNNERKVVFENLESDNFLEQSFGLPELVAKPLAGKEMLVLRGNYQDQISQTSTGKKVGRGLRRLYRIGASFVIGGLSISALYLLSLQSNVALSSLNPFAQLNPSESTASIAQTSDIDAFEQAQLTEQYKTTLPVEPSIEAELAAEDSLLAQFPKSSSETIVKEELKAPVASAKAKLEVKEKITPSTPITPAAATGTTADQPKEDKAEVLPVKSTVTASTSTINKRSKRFYVIMGVFSQDGYAEMNQKRLQKKGYEAKIISPSYDTKRQRVSVADFATEAEAFAALPALRTKISNELWVFNY